MTARAESRYRRVAWFGLRVGARDATPRWFGVSSGNGNDGVSQLFPDYYCRCTASEAVDLAAAAMISDFKPAGYQWAKENMTVDGESDYTISACISDPPDDEAEQSEDEDPMRYSEANGAWRIIEVFTVDDDFDIADCMLLGTDSDFIGPKPVVSRRVV